MPRVLNQDEIDAMVNAAREQGDHLQPGRRAMLSLTAENVSIRTLLLLSPGEVCNLRGTARTPGSLAVAGRGEFVANAVASGRCRAAQIKEPIAVSEEERRQ